MTGQGHRHFAKIHFGQRHADLQFAMEDHLLLNVFIFDLIHKLFTDAVVYMREDCKFVSENCECLKSLTFSLVFLH